MPKLHHPEPRAAVLAGMWIAAVRVLINCRHTADRNPRLCPLGAEPHSSGDLSIQKIAGLPSGTDLSSVKANWMRRAALLSIRLLTHCFGRIAPLRVFDVGGGGKNTLKAPE